MGIINKYKMGIDEKLSKERNNIKKRKSDDFYSIVFGLGIISFMGASQLNYEGHKKSCIATSVASAGFLGYGLYNYFFDNEDKYRRYLKKWFWKRNW